MMDSFFSSDTINNLNIDIAHFGSALVSSRIINNQILNDWNWIKVSLLTLLGFSIYNLIIANLINTSIIDNENIKMAIDDILKFGTMLLSLRLFLGESLNDMDWILGSCYILIGLIVYDFGTINLLNTKYLNNKKIISNKTKMALDDIIKFSTMLIISRWLSNDNFSKLWILESIGFIVGLVAYDYLISDYV